MEAYVRYLNDLRALLGPSLEGYLPVRFNVGGKLNAPRLFVKPPLRLQWRNTTIELRGYVDVYYSAVS
jgi:hypothetical protein